MFQLIIKRNDIGELSLKTTHMNLPLEHAEVVTEEIFGYIDEVSSQGRESDSFVTRLAVSVGSTFYAITLIITIFDYEVTYMVLNIETIEADEFLDTMNLDRDYDEDDE